MRLAGAGARKQKDHQNEPFQSGHPDCWSGHPLNNPWDILIVFFAMATIL